MTRKRPPKPQPTQGLYRFYACAEDGDDATLMGLVMARNDDEAMKKGFKLYPKSIISAYNKVWGVSDDPDDDEGAFYTVEDVCDRLTYHAPDGAEEAVEEAEYFLSSLPGLTALPPTVLLGMAMGLVTGYRAFCEEQDKLSGL